MRESIRIYEVNGGYIGFEEIRKGLFNELKRAEDKAETQGWIDTDVLECELKKEE